MAAPLSFTDLMAKADQGRLNEEQHVPYPRHVNGASFKFAHGTGALVTGSVIVQTGLTTVYMFNATVSGPTGFASGATEVDHVIAASITTGAVTVKGVYSDFSTGTRKLSASGTASFTWFAIGV